MIVDWNGSFYVLSSTDDYEREISTLFQEAQNGEIYVESRYVDNVVTALAGLGVVSFERPDGEAVEYDQGRWILLHWQYDVPGWDRLAAKRVA